MTRNLRRNASLVVLPFVLTLGLAACGDDSSDKADKGGKPSSSTSAPTDLPTSLSDIPDPRKDPEEFQDYLAGMYEKSGLSKPQATCMSKAFMENVDVDKLAGNDPSAITAAMNDKKLQDAVVDCMS